LERIKPSLAFFLFFMFGNTVNGIEENACIEPSVAAISGLLPGMSEASLNNANRYISVETATGEDDGGYYEALIYHYSKYDITVVRGMIDSIRISSPELLWAQKIKIGTDRNIVEKHIQPAPVVNDKAYSQYLVCSGKGDVYATLGYHNNKIKSIEMVIDRP
jgi:hypothetical protein